ncbi:MAG TPA: 4-hydroxy-3-methylbut-2-enyl diphosphate reductase [bacterium]|nr:4-hydroxy-3-methylbut-2-enyl diphosphate reductase [bacterium]
MKVIVAENSGVCFGVRRALDLLEESVKTAELEKRKAVMLGPLIHNPRVVEHYASIGVEVRDTENIPESCIVVVRSHGITLDAENKLGKIQGLTVVDTTCPYVKRIHQLVEKKSSGGYAVIVMGDKDHSEVQGITSRIKGHFLVVSPAEVLQKWSEVEGFITEHKKIYCVAQTTSRPANYDNMLRKIRKFIEQKKENIFESAQTICNATFSRQDSARELATRVDAMIVLGGMNSSNTMKLFQVVKEKNGRSYMVESVDDFTEEMLNELKKCSVAGLTAGASTPDDQILEMKNFLESLK